ncbi:hypothetical protein, partial [Pseudomonas sp. NCHU5216]|uniref:hypothetical protein n=1 Tax=Pseudomonas sp. NCHU5216 TaxID=3451355 RepID=UPI003F9E583C
MTNNAPLCRGVVFGSSRNLGKVSFETGLASLCVGFGVQAAYRCLADVSRFAPRRPSFVKRHKRRQKG